jgi:hypothetical protein
MSWVHVVSTERDILQGCWGWVLRNINRWDSARRKDVLIGVNVVRGGKIHRPRVVVRR